MANNTCFVLQADYCFTACHYTPYYRNPSCAKIPVPPLCKVPPKPIDPPKACDPRCFTGRFIYPGIESL